jgi:uncharacterized protein (DUF362 family)/Pyruvate/2-oxoacid:ferredoxin oxidoreductase delta subunit
MSKVAIVKCGSYDEAEVRAAVKRAVDLLGGAGLFVKSGEKILLKPNWLSADPPERCVTTHPAVFRAAAELFQGVGASLSYGDSPAFHSPDAAAKKSGIAAVADELSIPLADFHSGREVSFPEGRQNKVFTIANGALDADGIVSLCKMKTHALMRITGAVKNQFGCIPGPRKGEFHMKTPDHGNFARMLVDLNRFLKPRLFIMDGVMAMEGNGPRGGKPRQMGVILASADPVALDASFCRMIGLDPAVILTNSAGLEAGLGTYRAEDIEVLGDPIADFLTPDFDVKREAQAPASKSGRGMGLIQRALLPRPVIDSAKCVRCGVCVRMCPVTPKAVDWHDGDKSHSPTYEYDRCIRCFCCQELCPESAISVKLPLLRRLIGGNRRS